MTVSPGSRESMTPASGRLPVARPLELARLSGMLRDRGLGAELRMPGGGAGDGAGDTVALTGVAQDSRLIDPGDLFLAWKGTDHDAHDFLGDAMARGAAAALVERFVNDVEIPQLRVADGRSGAALAAMLVLGDPSAELRVTAVTGTNGKTTTALLVRHLLGNSGPSAALGTLGVVGPDGRVREGTGGLTTPGPATLARRIRALVDEGVRELVMEASSHALEQRRLDGLRVNIAAFTNLSRDHLDYHRSMEAYFEAKAHLLGLLSEDAEVVVNAGDPAWSGLPPVKARVRPVGFAGEPAPGIPAGGERLPALLAHRVRYSGSGSHFELREEGQSGSHEVRLPLLGRFNVENALVAAGVALAAGQALETVAANLSGAPAPTGRMELTLTEPVPVILDYAHTPDALERVIETLRPLYPGRLIVVFGAGGDRDRSKRPEMGRIAAEGTGFAIVTSDNPRTEDPAAIVDDIVAGMPAEAEGHRWIRIEDRRLAMARALEIAVPGDAILLAGKGHETYQVVGTEVRNFDERAVLRELLGGEVRP
ncbi:MAG: UDP-N-acetylmuramoyl-L-alanyl-D-glutamate--2,6-diaminopimelate ligase [Gemmatimonadales bacterium]|nr:MAG: UDP-N-acetylmuramoyl-L-alanyl-D-glutamate--2,6-diaminopimelate ligase [Gemmatimonadales bacterium]